MEEIIRLINTYWKFDNDQQHLSTWHDKQDLLEAIRQAKIWNKTAVSNLLCGSFEPDNKTSSATRCKCGREKWEHPNAT
jgi:hypothetical protein